MKLVYQENPKEWRKSALLPALGLAIASSVLRWRHILPIRFWLAILAVVSLLAIAALIRPQLFRRWYRFSQKLGFLLAQFVGRCVLTVFFICILTPVGLLLRLLGKDLLQLKRPPPAATYWRPAKEYNSLERLF
jgi:hypothetical protein